MPHFPDVVLWSIPAFIVVLALEALSFHFLPDDDDRLGYDVKDTRTSLVMGIGSLGWDLLWAIPIAFANALLFGWLYAATPWEVPHVGLWLVLAYVVYDFLYYWQHRGHHVVRILWASHVVHHSSQRFNLSTALRQPWTGFTSWLYYVPMAVLGFHPAVIAFCGGLNLVYQFWIHTERIGTMWRWYEWLFNTPSHHRVHHASQGSYLDRNFGGVLIVWDRMFGSWAAEVERPVYGLTKNIETYNPVRVAFHEYAAIGRDLRRAAGWRERLGRLVGPPGWAPAGSAGGPAAPSAPSVRSAPGAPLEGAR